MTRPDQSLAGVRVVVTRPEHQAERLCRLLEDRGAAVLRLPLIAIADPKSWAELDAATARLRDGAYRWVVFTSANAVERFLARAGPDSLTDEVSVAAVGAATAEALSAHDVTVALVPDRFTGEVVAEALGPGSGRVLLPRVEGAEPDLTAALEARGWEVDEVAAYRNVPGAPDPGIAAAVRRGDYDVITFASPSAVRNFVTILGEPSEVGLSSQRRPRRHVVCIGPTTARAVNEIGVKVDAIAEPHTDDGVISAIEALVAGQ